MSMVTKLGKVVIYNELYDDPSITSFCQVTSQVSMTVAN